MITASLCVFLFFTSVQGKKTTCIALAVTETGKATLTCLFSEDISQTQKDFAVYRHHDETTDVVSCWWISGTLDCFMEESYKFNKSATDKLTVEITRVTENETGTYSCEISGSDPADRDFCQLSTGITRCDIPSVELMSNTTLTCHFPEDINQTKKAYSVYHVIDKIPKAFLSCRWLSEVVKCVISNGNNEYDHVVSNITKVTIRQVTKKDEGLYTCVISGTTQGQHHFCQLTLLPATTCEIFPVKETENITLTCTFPEDLSLSRKTFYVSHNNDTVVSCQWIYREWNCTTKDAYKFVDVVTSRATVQIPSVTNAEAGNYSCHLSGSPSENINICELTHQATTCEIFPVKETENITLTCTFPEDLSLSRKTFYVSHNNDTVVSCQWIYREWNCTTKDAYKFVDIVTSRATVQIPSVTNAEAGNYSCHLSGSPSENIKVCELTHQGKGGRSSASEQNIALIIGPIAVIVLVVAPVCYKCRRRLPCQKPSKDRELPTPMQASEGTKVETPEDLEQHTDCSNSGSNVEDLTENHDQKKQRGFIRSKIRQAALFVRGPLRQEKREQHEDVPFMVPTPASDDPGNLGITEPPPQACTAAVEIHSQPDEATC